MSPRVARDTIDDEGTLQQYARLLLAVLALFVMQAALPVSTWSTIAELVAGSVALLLAIELGQVGPRWRLLAIASIAVGVVAVLVRVATDLTGAQIALGLVIGVLVASGPPAIFMAIRRHPVVSLRTLLGAVTIYLLVGMFFAFVYRSIAIGDPGSFSVSTGSADPSTMQYFSFITLTTVGFGDVVAVSSLARTLVALEALIGQIYLVTVVALVVGNMGAAVIRRPGRDPSADDGD